MDALARHSASDLLYRGLVAGADFLSLLIALQRYAMVHYH